MGPFAPRDIALIFLTLHALVACVVPVVLFAVIVRGLMAVNRKTEEAMPTLQGYARQMAQGAETASQKVTAPVVSAYSATARLQGMASRFSAPLRSKNRQAE